MNNFSHKNFWKQNSFVSMSKENLYCREKLKTFRAKLWKDRNVREDILVNFKQNINFLRNIYFPPEKAPQLRKFCNGWNSRERWLNSRFTYKTKIFQNMRENY